MVDPQPHAVVQSASSAKITNFHSVCLGMSQDRFQLVHLYTPLYLHTAVCQLSRLHFMVYVAVAAEGNITNKNVQFQGSRPIRFIP